MIFPDDRLVIEPKSKYYEVARGSTVNAFCNVTSSDQYTLNYKKVIGGMPPNSQVLPNGALVFLLTSSSMSGEYKCEATSSSGTHSASFYGKFDILFTYHLSL